MACLFDKRLIENEYDKEDSYQEGLKYELKRILISREVKVIPVIFGALDMTSKGFHSWLQLVRSNIYMGALKLWFATRQSHNTKDCVYSLVIGVFR